MKNGKNITIEMPKFKVEVNSKVFVLNLEEGLELYGKLADTFNTMFNYARDISKINIDTSKEVLDQWVEPEAGASGDGQPESPAE